MVYSNQDENSKRFKARRYYLPKGVMKTHNFITAGQGKDYTTKFDYD